MESLLQVFIQRDEMTKVQALKKIREMKKRVHLFGEDPEEVLWEEGLEPDYVFDLL